MTMGEKILRMRRARGWSQEELAERMNVSRQAVSRWEAGAAKPDADKTIVLCDLFGVSADYLLREDYSGERMEAPAAQPVRNWNIGKIFLGLYAGFSGICLFTLKFMSSVDPKPYIRKFIREDGQTVTQYLGKGLLAYAMHYNLEWLLVLACTGVLTGLVLIWKGSPSLRELVHSGLKKLRGLLRKG